MIEKALDKDGKRLFADGDKASLRREVAASVLQEIQLAMLEAGSDREVCLLYTSPSPRDNGRSRMPSSA